MIDLEVLLAQLKENSNKKFDEFNSKIINSSVKTIGCPVPAIRKIARKYADRIDEVVALPVNEYVEVDMLKGLVISQSKLPFAQKCVYLSDFAVTIENWAVCDISAVKVPASERKEYFDFFLTLVSSDKVFVCRYGIVNLLANYLDGEHIREVFESFENVVFGEYYIDMAAAWLVATAMAKCRDETVSYMEGEGRSVLNKFTYNKALQKMRDSFRISDEDKQWTRALKMQ